jgi:drug/metabolite transporter (DMT)-like permease
MSSHPKASRLSLVMAFAAIYVIWGSTYLGIRVAVQSIPPLLMASGRFAIAGILIFTLLKLRGAAWPTPRQWRDQSIIGVLLLLGGNGLVSWAEQKVPSGLTSLVLGAAPVIVVIFDWLRPGGLRPTLGVVTGVGVGVIGIFLLVGPGALPADSRPPLAYILCLFLSSISWWLGSFYSKHAVSGTPLLLASSMQMIVGSVATLVVGLAIGEGGDLHLASISSASWVAFGYLVVAGSLVAFPVYVWLLEHSTPTKVSTFSYVNPVVAVLLGWWLLHEPLTVRTLVAASVIIGAVAIVTVAKTRAPARS